MSIGEVSVRGKKPPSDDHKEDKPIPNDSKSTVSDGNVKKKGWGPPVKDLSRQSTDNNNNNNDNATEGLDDFDSDVRRRLVNLYDFQKITYYYMYILFLFRK